MSAPKPGCMAWVRAWYGIPAKRGALVTVAGERGWIASASDGFVNVYLWNGTARRVQIRPTELVFA